MFHRACSYTNQALYALTVPVEHEVTTDKIGVILQDSHIHFFYLTVQKNNTSRDIISLLQKLPGDWRKLEPQAAWPDTFFGHFPKKSPFENEREREERLNREVRIPLIRELKNTIFRNEVDILITRACRYT